MTDISGASRDRFSEASNEILLHLSDKVVALTRNNEFKDLYYNLMSNLFISFSLIYEILIIILLII